MKRIITGIVLLFVLAGGVFVSLPWLVSSEAVRIRILEQARMITGREMSFRQAPKVLFNPFLAIEINSVVFEDANAGPDDPPLLQMETLRGHLDVFSALFGQIDIKLYQFIRPSFSLRIRADGEASWAFPSGEVWHVLEHARATRTGDQAEAGQDKKDAPTVRLGDFEIIDGTVEYASARSGTRETFTNFNARLQWADTNAPLLLAGDCIWRDEAIAFSIRTSDPVALLSGVNAPLNFKVDSNAFSTDFSGQANTLSDLHLTGTMRSSSPSIRRILKLLGQEFPNGSTFAGFSAEGEMKGTLRQMQLTEATVEFDGNRGRGVLQIGQAKTGRISVNGTLAVETLNLDPYAAAIRQEAEIGKGGIPARQLLDGFDVDLRLSAKAVQMSNLQLSNAAVSLTVQNRQASVDLGNATLFGGTLIGKLSLNGDHGQANLSGNAMLQGFDGAAISGFLPGENLAFEGRGNAQIEINSRGQTMKSLLESFWARSTLQMKSGVLRGMNFGILAELARQETEGGTDPDIRGSTTFVSLDSEFAFNRDSTWIRSLQISGDKWHAVITGRMSTDFEAIALNVHMQTGPEAATQTDDPDAKPEENRHLLFIGGSLATPLVTAIPSGNER